MTSLPSPASPQDLPSQQAAWLGREAQGLMESGRMLCAPAVLGVLNQRLDGGLGLEMVQRLTAALPNGMHHSGEVCGALSGAMLALGLFLGQGREVEKAARALHRQFQAAHGSCNCLTLTRQAGGRRARKELCAQLTGLAAQLAADLILARRPELAAGLPSACRPLVTPPAWWRRLRPA